MSLIKAVSVVAAPVEVTTEVNDFSLSELALQGLGADLLPIRECIIIHNYLIAKNRVYVTRCRTCPILIRHVLHRTVGECLHVVGHDVWNWAT